MSLQALSGLGLVLLLAAPAQAQPLTNPSTRGIPLVEKREDLSCLADIYRLEQLRASLLKAKFRQIAVLGPDGFPDVTHYTWWVNPEGSVAEVRHTADGAVCIWREFPLQAPPPEAVPPPDVVAAKPPPPQIE